MRRTRAWRFILTTTLLTWPVAAAAAPLQVKWDCYLPGSDHCRILETSYSDLAFITFVGDGEPEDFSVEVRSLEIEDGTEYRLSFLGGDDRPSFTILDRVSSSLDSLGRLNRVYANLIKGTTPYSEVKDFETRPEDGTLVVEIGAPGSDVKPPPESSDETGWYVSPSLSGSYARAAGTESINGMGALTLNWSDPSWRFNASTSASYASVDYGDNPLISGRSTTFRYGGKMVVVHSFTEKWSVAVLGTARRVHSDYHSENGLPEGTPRELFTNDATFAAGSAGVEWNLVPFRKTNEGVVALRYVAGAQHHQYFDPEALAPARLDFFSHVAQAYFAWHFKHVDVSATLGVKSQLPEWKRTGFEASASASWRITNNLVLSANVSADYQNNRISSPAAPGGSGGNVAGGQKFDDLSVFGMLSLSYYFGNSMLHRQDQRWNDAGH